MLNILCLWGSISVTYIKATEMEWVEIRFRFFSSCILLYLSTDLRMQDCSLPIFEPVRCFVINRSVNEILESSWTRLHTFATKCPRDAYDGGWMLIRDHVKFPRSAWSTPEGGLNSKKRVPFMMLMQKKKKSYFLWLNLFPHFFFFPFSGRPSFRIAAQLLIHSTDLFCWI